MTVQFVPVAIGREASPTPTDMSAAVAFMIERAMTGATVLGRAGAR